MAAAGLTRRSSHAMTRVSTASNPRNSVCEYLWSSCGAREVVVGEDFGRGNAGTIELRGAGERYGFGVITVTDIEV